MDEKYAIFNYWCVCVCVCVCVYTCECQCTWRIEFSDSVGLNLLVSGNSWLANLGIGLYPVDSPLSH